MGDPPGDSAVPTPAEPHPKLVELSGILVGTWRVSGTGIDGIAEYRSARDGLLLVAHGEAPEPRDVIVYTRVEEPT